MRREMLSAMGMCGFPAETPSEVIPNPVGEEFLVNSYSPRGSKPFDFVTIRPLDGAKYAVDQVVKYAHSHPHNRFLLIGKGQYFAHNEKPKNLVWKDCFASPDEMLEVLSKSRCALMPTRLDAQGVSMCEMASYGIPLLTSDLDVCREMLSPFPNVGFLPPEGGGRLAIPPAAEEGFGAKTTFDGKVLVQREVDFAIRVAG